MERISANATGFRLLLLIVALGGTVAVLEAALGHTPLAPKFKVLVLAESGGHHVDFTKAAMPWLKQYGEENGFEVDYIHNTTPITEAFLAKYRVVLQLDYVPYGWTPEAKQAFRDYIEKGRGGWVGLHHATLLGEFDGQPMWPWFSEFMGGIRFKSYIPKFTAGTVRVEDRTHPCISKNAPLFLNIFTRRIRKEMLRLTWPSQNLSGPMPSKRREFDVPCCRATPALGGLPRETKLHLRL